MASMINRFFGIVVVSFLVLIARLAVTETTGEKDCPFKNDFGDEHCKSLLDADMCFLDRNGKPNTSHIQYMIEVCGKTCLCDGVARKCK